MRVDDLLNFLFLVVDEVVCCDEISPLKDILSLAMTEHDVSLNASLWVLCHVDVVFVFSFCLDHFFGLCHVLIGCC